MHQNIQNVRRHVVNTVANVNRIGFGGHAAQGIGTTSKRHFAGRLSIPSTYQPHAATAGEARMRSRLQDQMRRSGRCTCRAALLPDSLWAALVIQRALSN